MPLCSVCDTIFERTGQGRTEKLCPKCWFKRGPKRTKNHKELNYNYRRKRQ